MTRRERAILDRAGFYDSKFTDTVIDFQEQTGVTIQQIYARIKQMSDAEKRTMFAA